MYNTSGNRWFSSDLFSWHPKQRAFVSEISTLLNHGGNLGESFGMVSAKTGKAAIFTFYCADRTKDGEVTGWRFILDFKSFHDFPQLAGVTVFIIND